MNASSPSNGGAPATPPKPVTIRHIAETLGITKTTVSTALSGRGRVSPAMREKILALAEELGYNPDPLAQRLSSRAHSKVVALCSGRLTLGLATEKIALIQAALNEMGLDVPIYTSQQKGNNSQAALFRQVRQQRPQAIVCAVYSLQESAFAELQAFQAEGGIVVSYDIPMALACDQVVFDREDNAYQGAKYLLERGHRDIGMGMSQMSKVAASDPYSPQGLRLQGFQRALNEFGVSLRDEWLIQNSGRFEQGGAEMANRFLCLPKRPTGLCIVNDYSALAFMVEVMRAGVRVPQDLSIVGYDNQPVALYCPVPLTSCSQPAEKIVQAVISLLSSRLQGDDSPPRTVTVRGEITERQSVVPI